MASPKLGRNDPCPCGSLKKYKHCCFNKPKSSLKPLGAPDVSALTTLFNTAFNKHQGGQIAEAEVLYQQVLALAPEHANALHLLGLIYHQTNRADLGLQLVLKAISIKPDYTMFNNLANMYREQNNTNDAIQYYQQAIALNPNYAEAYNNLGVSFQDIKEYGAAIESYQKALQLKPDYAEAFGNIANTLKSEHKLEAALAYYDKALTLKPDNPDFHHNLGATLKSLQRYEQALISYKKALDLRPNYADTYSNIAHILKTQNKLAEAIYFYQKALSLKPNHAEALGSLFYAQQYCCEWTDYEHHQQQVITSIMARQEGYKPLSFLAVSDSAAAQLSCAEVFAETHHYQAIKYNHTPSQSAAKKIKLAYISADFRDHALTILMVELFERHDRERFEVIAISLKQGSSSSIGNRVVKAFDQFIDATAMSDTEVADLIVELKIDIAIDLMGYTANSRTDILCFKPAPIQVNYLGYPGTMGLKVIDYIIADQFVIPPALKEFYTEQVVYLPDCYQVNDGQRYQPKGDLIRADYGLNVDSFVFCSFNNSYKVTPVFFAIWMRLLAAVPNSVLWLLADNPAVELNQKQFAVACGINPDRLIFAKKVTYQEYLGRYQLADLCLDTLPFNAGTTASDALWVGLPIVTCAGEAFAGRMAGSLLQAIGLPELVTEDLASYEAMAIKLATHPSLLADIKARLLSNKNTQPLFDSQRFCEHLEIAYETMWERYQQGLQPECFSVELAEKYRND